MLTDCAALVEPTTVPLNVSDDAERSAVAKVAPLPESAIVCGLLAALFVSVMSALRAPLAPGVKTMAIWQLAVGNTAPTHVLVMLKSPASVPLTLTAETFSVAVPVLFSVTDRAALATPTLVFEKATLVPDRLTIGAETPVPVRDDVCVPPGASSVTVSVPLSDPAASGVNFTWIVHEAADASVAPQLVVSAKSLPFVPLKLIPLMLTASAVWLVSVKS